MNGERMDFAECCPNRQLAWTHSRVGDRWSDIYACASCQHIHKMESWPAPIEWPGAERCVNCGGGYVMVAAPKSRQARPAEPACDRCGLTAAKDKDLHDGLAALHPERSYVLGAEVAAELGRHVLALKLATASTRWGSGDDGVVGRVFRLQALEALGLLDRALDEAYDWAHHGAPLAVWGIIATLETASDNLEGALKAIKYGVQIDPKNTELWADYSELLLHFGEGSRALDAAAHYLSDPELRERGLAVIVEVATKFYFEKRLNDAKAAVHIAGAHVETSLPLLWLMARLAAQEGEEEPALQWIGKVLKLDPNHAEAKAALEQLNPTQTKKGWLW